MFQKLFYNLRNLFYLNLGVNGYRIILKNMEVFGASNFTVKTIKYGLNEVMMEAMFAEF